jgi:hypothetical protein
MDSVPLDAGFLLASVANEMRSTEKVRRTIVLTTALECLAAISRLVIKKIENSYFLIHNINDN